jgi:hypothetical protein
MTSRSKVVEVLGSKFEVRKLDPQVGSFILMKMMGLTMRMAAEQADEPPTEKPQEPEEAERPKITGEQHVRALTFAVFSGGIGFDDFKFIQNACLKSVSALNEQTGFYIPVMMDHGKWTPAGTEVEGNVGMLTELVTQVLVFCYADFFESGGLGSKI